MNALLWLIAGIIGLVAVVYQFSAIDATVRSRQAGRIALALLLLVVFVFVAFGVHFPIIVGLVALGTGFAARLLLRRSTRSPQQAERAATLSATHLALLTGTFIFMLPFAWLVSTSLKIDDEQAVFPPVWIPTQQVTTDAIHDGDGKPAKLSHWHSAAHPEIDVVAEIADLPTGDVKVAPVGAGGNPKTFTAARADLVKIRQVAPRWQNYSEALTYLPKDTFYGLTFLGNTLFLTIMRVVGTLIASSLVAYSFARLHWPGRNQIFILLLATLMIPGAVTMMPQFLIYRGLGWIDTLKPLWVPAFFGSAFNIFLLRQFFMSIPTELEDAAKIDGCGPFGVYWKIMLPLVKPALAAIAIMGTLAAWNDFQGPLIYLSSPEKMPLAYALQLYQQAHSGEQGLLMAASTMVVLPIIILFFFTQRYFIEGVSLSGLGGR